MPSAIMSPPDGSGTAVNVEGVHAEMCGVPRLPAEVMKAPSDE